MAMKADEIARFDEEYTARLAACDEALAHGTSVPDLNGEETSPALRLRLEQGLVCLQLLQHLRPVHDPASPIPAAAASKDASSETDDLPARIGRFQIYEELGRGAFGVVFRAYDPRLEREVALKVPRAEALVNPELRERFLREARAAAALNHPNVVPVYDADAVGPICYIASAYCPGLTLAQWLEQQVEPVPERAAVQLLITLAEALQHAHNCDIVHRDFKPSNILLSPVPATGAREQLPANQTETWDLSLGSSAEGLKYIPRITDFGLAKFLADGESGPTKSVAILGTPRYMAPEQAWGQSRDVGPAADIFALGVILYELLTGRTPFEAKTDLETLRRVREHEPTPPRALRRGLDRGLQAICLKCLEKEPKHRYGSAQALANDLKRWLLGDTPDCHCWPERVRRLVRCRGFQLATVAVFLFGLVAIGVPSLLYLRHPDRWLEYYEGQLDNQRPATLIGVTGLPHWFRVSTTQTPVEVFPANDGTVSVKCAKLALVELMPDPRQERYCFSVEVRHDLTTELNGEAGIYFLHCAYTVTADKIGHYFCALGYNDLIDLRAYTRGKAQNNLAELTFQRYIEPDYYPPISRDRFVSAGFRPAAPGEGAGLWRKLVVKVTPDTIAASFPDPLGSGKETHLRPVPRSKWQEKAAFLATNPIEDQLPIVPQYQSRSALGLFVYRGTASFRSAVVTPLPENN